MAVFPAGKGLIGSMVYEVAASSLLRLRLRAIDGWINNIKTGEAFD